MFNTDVFQFIIICISMLLVILFALGSADSKIMAASHLFINDIFKPYSCKNKEVPD